MRAKAREGSIDKYESLDSRERQLYEEDILAIHVLRYVGNVTGTRTGLTTILTGMTMTSGECEDSPSPHIGRYLSYSMICLCADPPSSLLTRFFFTTSDRFALPYLAPS
jgi:hypothetical protein